MSKQRLTVEQVGDITQVKFLDKRILDEPTIQAIAEQLFSLVEQEGKRKLLLNFDSVEYMSSAALGKLISVPFKFEMSGSRIALYQPDGL